MFSQVTQVITISADLSLEDQCVKTVERTLELLGGLDVLVNNAGYLAKALMRNDMASGIYRITELAGNVIRAL